MRRRAPALGETCDEGLLVGMLDDYDKKWGTSLRAEYDRVAHGRVGHTRD
jgi:hypothetical protein